MNKNIKTNNKYKFLIWLLILSFLFSLCDYLHDISNGYNNNDNMNGNYIVDDNLINVESFHVSVPV